MIELPLLSLALLAAPDASLGEPSTAPVPTPPPISLIAPFAVARNDDDPWYMRVNLGLTTTEDVDEGSEEIDFDEGWLIALAVGQRVTSGDRPLHFNLELEGLYTDQDADDDGLIMAVEDLNVGALFLNGLLDLHLAERFSIYGGLGIGPAWLDVGTSSGFDDEDGPFLAWQARAGFTWHFAETTAFQIGYRFVNVDDAEIDDGGLGSAEFDLETQQHGLELGLCFGI